MEVTRFRDLVGRRIGRLPRPFTQAVAAEYAAEPWLLTHAPDNADDFAGALNVWLNSQSGDRGHWRDAEAQARRYSQEHFAWPRLAARITAFIADLEVQDRAPSRGPQSRITPAALRS